MSARAHERGWSAPRVLGMLEDALREHPYRTLAIAAGVGCVLATRLGRSLIVPLVARAGIGLASTAIAPLLDDLGERRPA